MTPAMYPVLLLLAFSAVVGSRPFPLGRGRRPIGSPEEARRSSGDLRWRGEPGAWPFFVPHPQALGSLGLSGSYMVWVALLATGLILYFLMGRNSPYFQLLEQGREPAEARRLARSHGQELFPSGNLKESLLLSARSWKTWALVAIYFTTFGGFVALTAWLPTYWTAFFGLSVMSAGFLTALFSILTCVLRVVGGILSDRLLEGGENTTILALLIMMVGAIVMLDATSTNCYPGSAYCVGWGVSTRRVQDVPQAVPQAVGGALGWWGDSAHSAVSCFRSLCWLLR